MTIKTVNDGQDVTLHFDASLAETVSRIEAAGAEEQDGIVQANEMAAIFPAQAELHMTMTEYSALIAAGCVEAK